MVFFKIFSTPLRYYKLKHDPNKFVKSKQNRQLETNEISINLKLYPMQHRSILRVFNSLSTT